MATVVVSIAFSVKKQIKNINSAAKIVPIRSKSEKDNNYLLKVIEIHIYVPSKPGFLGPAFQIMTISTVFLDKNTKKPKIRLQKYFLKKTNCWKKNFFSLNIFNQKSTTPLN